MSEPLPDDPLRRLVPLLRRATRVFAALAAVYAVLWFVHHRFPYYGEGGRVVTAEKLRHVSDQPIFPNDAPRRVVIFGNSKVLSGFVPDRFDELGGGRVVSYNLGLPNAEEFVSVLETLLRAGSVPTDVLITIPWEEPPPRNPLVFVHDDEAMLARLVPFRHIVRDGAIFLRRALRRGGPAALYRETQRDSRQILADRGYYFISGQSHFAGDRLPDDFRVDSDQPEVQQLRRPPVDGPVFRRLESLLEQHDIQAWLVPTYYRIGQYAPAGDRPNEALVQALANHPRFHVLGPDYALYPNALFSDRVHLNREGALRHTEYLWSVFAAAAEPAAP